MTNVRSLDDTAHAGLMMSVTAERDVSHTPATAGCSSLSHASKDACRLRSLTLRFFQTASTVVAKSKLVRKTVVTP
jgi:hypothetical protein